MQICKFTNNNKKRNIKKMLLSKINLHLCSHKIMTWNREKERKKCWWKAKEKLYENQIRNRWKLWITGRTKKNPNHKIYYIIMKSCFADDKLKNVSLTFVCINHSSSSLTEINLYSFFCVLCRWFGKRKRKAKKKNPIIWMMKE